ncbi:MAG: tRNA (adenosine(37)-N6)-threonylcarbamoyltransferase complex transferase subunit TsaD [Rhodobacteraceae bacterium]|nr:tRNA (adenosine(37)-N6)-threonylcarbamoyltransferase complex transferase subunit TsaD [Paracoccaceae bacterium]
MGSEGAVGAKSGLTILGLESSCDETAAAVVREEVGKPARILSSVIYGQADLHADYGGVVPEIAARAHAERLDTCVRAAVRQAGLTLHQVDAVAVAAGPGLIGGLLAGVMCAKGLAAGLGSPLLGVNHLAGHALTPRLTHQVPYPYLLLLASGGHCQFLIVRGFDDFSRLGGTLDDAPGEVFDKVARMVGLGQPGGPQVEAAAQGGNSRRFALPRPLLEQNHCNMSFSGLKTAVLRVRDALVARKGGLTQKDRADLCASLQAAISDVFCRKSAQALALYLQQAPPRPLFAVAGGVAANACLRAGLKSLAARHAVAFLAPPLWLCTDNAAMIAYVGLERLKAGQQDTMALAARPRWPLDSRATPLIGGGKKGARA